MSAIVIGMAVTSGIAGGAIGVGYAFLNALGNALGRGDGEASLLKPTLAGVFIGAALGGGAGWVLDGGVGRYMHEAGERAVINSCLKKVDNGEFVTLGKNEAGEVRCAVVRAPAPGV